MDIIRKHRTAFSVVFVIAALGLILSMFVGTGMGGSGMGSSTVAQVDGEEISTRELVGFLDQQMRQAESMLQAQSQGNPESRKFMEQFIRAQISPDRVLQQLVQKKFLATTADKAGMKASPEALRDLIQNDPEFHKEGVFDTLSYKQRVGEPGKYEAELARQIKFMNFSRAFESGLAIVSPLEKLQAGIFENKYVFESLSLSPKAFPEPSAVGNDEVQAFLAKAENAQRTQALYDAKRAEFESAEKVRARHILIKDQSAASEAKIKEILAEVKDGKITFEKAAQKYSQDASNAPKGGDLGFFTAETMDASFSQAAFGLKEKNDISAPVKSAFGWHLIQLVDRQAPSKKAFDDVKTTLASQLLLEEKKSEKAKAWLESFKQGKVPSDAEVKKLGLSWTKQAEWSPLQDKLGTVGAVDAQLGEILKLDPKTNPYLKQPLTQGDKLFLLRLVEIKRPTDPAVKKDVAKLPPAVAELNTESKLEADKAQTAFQYYLQTRFEKLEKDKKIVRSEKVLANLRKQVQEGR